MRVFNKEKTQELFYYDLENGYLQNDKLLVNSTVSLPAVQGVGHFKYKRYPNGGEERVWVWDVEPLPAVEAKEEYEEIQVYIPYTASELKEKRAEVIKTRLSQLSQDFVQAWAGAKIEDIESRKAEFSVLHNELREILGKEPRVYF